MKVLQITDTHLGHVLPVLGAPQGYSRAQEAADRFREALEPALREEVDLVVHSGDLFDRSAPPSEAIACAVETLREVARRVPVVVIPGNHDRRGLRRYLPFSDLHVVDQPERFEIGGLALGLVPFVRDAHAWSASASRVGEGVDVVVAHQAFHGHQVPGFTFRFGQQADTIGAHQLPKGVSHIMCGHIHHRQRLVLGDAEVYVPGSTLRTSFAEQHEPKGAAIWSFGRTTEVEATHVEDRRMVVVAKPTDIFRVGPGTLVKLRAPSLTEADVAERGGWIVPTRRRARRRAAAQGPSAVGLPL